MPIVRTYGDAGLLGQLAQAAGKATGKAERERQLRPYDEAITRQHMERLARRDAEPSFFERAMQGTQAEIQAGKRQQQALDLAAEKEARLGRTDAAKLELERQREERLRQGATAEAREESRIQRARDEALAALDAQVPPEQRGLEYHLAKRAIAEGETVQRSLVGEITGRNGGDGRRQFKPSTAFGKATEAAVDAGRFEDIAGYIGSRKQVGDFPEESDPLSTEALEARAIFDAWMLAPTTDPDEASEALDALEEAGADAGYVEEKRSELRRHEIAMIEAVVPAAMESYEGQVVNALQSAARKAGGRLTREQTRQIKADVLKATAERLDVPMRYIREWMNLQAEKRQKERAAQIEAQRQAMEAIEQSEGGQREQAQGRAEATGQKFQVGGGKRPSRSEAQWKYR